MQRWNEHEPPDTSIKYLDVEPGQTIGSTTTIPDWRKTDFGALQTPLNRNHLFLRKEVGLEVGLWISKIHDVCISSMSHLGPSHADSRFWFDFCVLSGNGMILPLETPEGLYPKWLAAKVSWLLIQLIAFESNMRPSSQFRNRIGVCIRNTKEWYRMALKKLPNESNESPFHESPWPKDEKWALEDEK